MDLIWKDESSAPRDGRTLLLVARLNTDGTRFAPLVGFWHQTEHEWRPEPTDDGTELIVTHWMEISTLPTVKEL
jgi:hypothetical protein